MTQDSTENDPTTSDIPELMDQLEGSLRDPDPVAIRAGLDQRATSRKRAITAAGALVAVFAIAGGVLALTQDNGTSNVTADDTGIAETTRPPNDATAPPTSPPTTGETTTTPPTTTPSTTAHGGEPPSFEPSNDLVLSGRWQLVGMWNDGQPVDLAAFGARLPTMGILGRRLSGDDGCNDHGGGVFYPTADGRLQVQGGNTTNMGCIGDIFDLFQSGALGADRWGRTPESNLVLTNGVVTTEFTISEAAPAGTPRGLSAPLNTIWNSESIGDYDNFDTESSRVVLTLLTQDDGTDLAVLTVKDCGEFGFNAVFDDVTEGEISFDPLEDPNMLCEPTGDAATAVQALARADYFATVFGGMQLWDGPTPLAVFADE